MESIYVSYALIEVGLIMFAFVIYRVGLCN